MQGTVETHIFRQRSEILTGVRLGVQSGSFVHLWTALDQLFCRFPGEVPLRDWYEAALVHSRFGLQPVN
jgi:hypothetical protein